MISDHITDIITATKETPNSLWRNKTISALQSALAASKMMEAENIRPTTQNGLESHGNGQKRHVYNDERPSECSCLPGALDRNCPVHSV